MLKKGKNKKERKKPAVQLTNDRRGTSQHGSGLLPAEINGLVAGALGKRDVLGSRSISPESAVKAPPSRRYVQLKMNQTSPTSARTCPRWVPEKPQHMCQISTVYILEQNMSTLSQTVPLLVDVVPLSIPPTQTYQQTFRTTDEAFGQSWLNLVCFEKWGIC